MTPISLSNAASSRFSSLQGAVSSRPVKGEAAETLLSGEVDRSYAAAVSGPLATGGSSPAAATIPFAPTERAGGGQSPSMQSPRVGKLPSVLQPQDEVTLSSVLAAYEAQSAPTGAPAALEEPVGLDQAPPPSMLRAARLDRIAAAIEAGTYEDDAKLEAAVDRLLDRL